MGRVAAAHGVRGWIKVKPFTETPQALLGYPIWWLAQHGGDPRAHRLIEGRVHNALLVVQLEGLESREQAALVRGYEVSVPRSELPDTADDEVYWGDLVDCEVVNRSGEHLGEVIEVQASAGHPLLRVGSSPKSAGKAPREHLIPLVPRYVLVVDLQTNRVEVDWEAEY